MTFEIEDINSICRVCMKSGDLQCIFKFKDRFHKEYDDLSRKLSLCGGVDIRIDDNLPHKICEVCSDTLILAYDLKTLCQTTDAFLKNIIYKNNQEQNGSVELNSHGKSNKTIFKDIKLIKTFPLEKENDSHKEFLNSTEGIDRNYEDTSLNNDSAANSDILMEDEINVNLQSEKLDPLDAMEKEGGPKKYKCYACEKFLPTRWDRQLHEDLECPLMPPGTMYKCRICPATAPDRDKFDNHIWLHHRGTSPPAKNLPNVTKPVMEIKKINVEKTQQDIICEQCGMQIKNMQTFKIHCLRHKGKSWFNCKQCSFKSTNRHSYNIHMKYNHLGHEFLKCPHCTFITHRKGNLDVHLRRHTGERPYPCNMCEYKAINHSNWKRHMITHTNYRGFECKICGKFYSSNKVLKTHIMRIHEHVKIFHCKPCHTKYVGEEALNRHLQRKHNTTGDSPAQVSHK